MSGIVSPSASGTAGIAWALASVLAFSTNDMLIKFLSGDYPLHQIILTRSLIGMVVVLAVILPLSGGIGSVRTKRLGLHLLRGFAVVLSNVFFFMALAAMPLAEAVAIFFICPLLISVASVVFLGETVGPRRWAAIGIGLVGVGIVLRPGTEAFQMASLLPLVAAVCYTALHTLTRKIGATEGAGSLIFYIQLCFIVSSAAVGLVAGHGEWAGSGDPSLEFLLRAWVVPPASDLGVMAFIGVASAVGGYAIGQAYRLSEAALVAPIEYAAIPMSVFWGWVMFAELPDGVAFGGMALILSAGLILVWREAVARRVPVSPPPRAR
jgi:drug/metabolite transporter (DMT)-like permease